jgi:hypothetical protein
MAIRTMFPADWPIFHNPWTTCGSSLAKQTSSPRSSVWAGRQKRPRSSPAQGRHAPTPGPGCRACSLRCGALAAFRLLVVVVAPAFAGVGRLDALRIDNAVAWGGPPAVFFGASRSRHPACPPKLRAGFITANGHTPFAKAGNPHGSIRHWQPVLSG